MRGHASIPTYHAPKGIPAVLGVCKGFGEPAMALQSLPGFPDGNSQRMMQLLNWALLMTERIYLRLSAR